MIDNLMVLSSLLLSHATCCCFDPLNRFQDLINLGLRLDLSDEKGSSVEDIFLDLFIVSEGLDEVADCLLELVSSSR